MTEPVEFQNREIARFMKGLEKRLNQITEGDNRVEAILNPIIQRDIAKHFDREKGPNNSWAPWSTPYAEYRAKFGGGKILQRTGALRSEATTADVKFQDNGYGWKVSKRTTSGFDYAAFQNEKRPFMWISDKALEEAAKSLLGHILKED